MVVVDALDDRGRESVQRAWAQRDETLTRKRARSVYACFLICGVFAPVFVGVVVLAPDYAVFLGLLVAPWVALAALAGLCNALMTWRVPRVRALLLLTVFVVVSSVLSFVTIDLAPASWVPGVNVFGEVMFVGSGLYAIGVSLRGLGESAAPASG